MGRQVRRVLYTDVFHGHRHECVPALAVSHVTVGAAARHETRRGRKDGQIPTCKPTCSVCATGIWYNAVASWVLAAMRTKRRSRHEAMP